MKIHPLKPLVLPGILLVIFLIGAAFIPSYEPFDSYFIGLIQALPDSLGGIATFITHIGDPIPLILVALAVASWELYRRNYVRSFVMAGSLVVMPTFYLFKESIQRARPLTEYVATHDINGYSFPSGHASSSMAVYGMIFVLAYSHLHGKWRLLVTSASALLIVLIGMTRVYLGAHFPSDVIAGWIVGLLVITLLRSVSLFIAKHPPIPEKQAVEDSTEESA